MLSSKSQRRPMKMRCKPNNEPKVSAIVPTYNRGYSISRALKSIEEQTQSVHEILVVDDGSTDDTQKIVSQKHPAVRVIKNPTNRGVSSARNLGISSSTGSHLAFLDSDDTWHPEKIEKQLLFCQQEPKVNINHCDEIWMKNGKKDKMTWLNKHTRIAKNNINLVQRADKRKFAVDERGHPAVLIDDHIKNIKEWRAAGGIGIHHTSTATTIAQLKKMGF